MDTNLSAVDLTKEACIPCKVGAPTVTEAELAAYSKQTHDWQIVEVEGVKRLRRIFKFEDFKTALAFTDKVGALAEANHHHPVITLTYGMVTIEWWTHKINGMHRNDFIMAAKTDLLNQA